MTQPFRVAGVDFGSDSVRVGIWDLSVPACLLVVSRAYCRWADGAYCAPELQRFRQHPRDYLEALEDAFAEVAARLGPGAVTALAIDTTGSTPAPTDARGVPLALLPEHAEDPDAMFWLWKDHVAADAAVRINEVLGAHDPDFTTYQGLYSSEWWWAKILHGVTHSETIRRHAVSWVEHSDWLANLLVGADDVRRFARNSCAAGHKALVNRRLGGMIPSPILAELHPHLAAVAETFQLPPVPAGTPLGTLTADWARRLQLSEHTVVGAGSLDAHAGAVGAGIAPGTLVKVVGTSTVDMFLTDYDAVDGHDIRTRCGVAEDSIIPGQLGGEAGQAAFGDLLAWYAGVLAWPWETVLRAELADVLPADQIEPLLARLRQKLLPELNRATLGRPPAGIVALDWINGRRYPHVDDRASAALLNLRIGHDAVDLYRSLVQSAVLGSKAIFEGIREVAQVDRVILVGGVARKSPLICQALADALGTEVMVSKVDEISAAGAAGYAAVAAGAYSSIPAAQQALCAPYQADFWPSAAGRAEYSEAFRAYQQAATITGQAPVAGSLREGPAHG